MEKGKRVEAEFALPEAMIQHIQSFLSRKQAAQTSILSKSWYSAWSTRPNLDIDQRDFFRNRNFSDLNSEINDGLSEFAKSSMQRYEELNLKIESFRLWMSGSQRYGSLAAELIVKATKIGATDLNIKFKLQNPGLVLPHEVLRSENLIRLSVCGCKIDGGVDRMVSCSRLKSLSLRRMFIQSDIIWDIISSCPLIEELLLSDCTCLLKVPAFDVFTRTMTTRMSLSPFIEFGKRNVGSVVDCPIHLYEFRKLKCLLLEMVHIYTWFFHDFSSKFPCLKDLSVHYCVGYKRVQISSSSLECISFAQETVLSAKFDVPCIHKFRFSGLVLPFLSFETASREWNSDISITCNHPSTSWFLRLKKFLTKLSLSKVSLSLNIGPFLEKSFDYNRDVEGLPKPIVENIKLSMYRTFTVCPALLNGLFWSCCPKFITQCWLPKSCLRRIADRELLQLLCKTLMQEVSENCYIPNRNRLGINDLEEVNVELFEESLAVWRPLPVKALLNDSTGPKNEQKIRFQLRWGLETSTFK